MAIEQVHRIRAGAALRTATLLAAALLANGAAQAQMRTDAAAFAAAAQPGDEKLTCEEIKAEGMALQTRTDAAANAKMSDKEIAELKATASAGAARGLLLGTLSAAAGLIPGTGQALGRGAIEGAQVASSLATRAKMNAQGKVYEDQRRAEFDTSSTRLYYLMALHREKCN